MRLILIRHGEGLHYKQRRIAGVLGCTGLSPLGIEQAQAVAKRLSADGDLAKAKLLCSPVMRAKQTAQVVGEAMQLTAQVDEALAEIHPGEADGMVWPDYVERFGAFDMVLEPERPFAPGGESWQDFMRRVHGALERFAQDYRDETVLAVTHGGFVETAMLILFDIPRPGTGAELDASNTSLTEWQHKGGLWHLVRFNDTTHLNI